MLLATEHKKVWSSNIRYFRVQRPNISACGRFELQDLERTYQRVCASRQACRCSSDSVKQQDSSADFGLPSLS